MKIKKGDVVKVISGREKGKTAKVLEVDLKNCTVLLEKLNLVKRHQKPNQKNKQGGIIEKEAPVHVSNVMYFEEKTKKGCRIGMRTEGDKRVRISRRSGNELVESH